MGKILFILELSIVITFILLFIFMIGGGFTYSHIRIFDTYIEVHNLWRPLLVGLILIGIVELLKYICNLKTRKWAFERPVYYFITALGFYNAMVIPFVLFRYYSFGLIFPDDLAHTNQALFNTLQGYPFATTCFGYIFHNWNIFGDHFTPILIFLLPIYFFFQDASTLLVIQVIFISLGAIPIYFISKNRLKSEWLGLFISMIYLSYPLITKSIYGEFRFDYLAMVFLLFGFWSLENGKRWLLFAFLFLALLCKEDMFIPVTMVSLYIFFRRDFKYGLAIGLFSILFGAVVWRYLMPYFREFTQTGVYAYKFNNLAEIFSGEQPFFENIKQHGGTVVSHLMGLVRGLGYVPVFSPVLIFSIGTFLESIIGCIALGEDYIAGQHWHSALFIPFIFIAYIYGINNLLILTRRFLRQKRFLEVMFWAWIIGVPLSGGLLDFNMHVIQPFCENKLSVSYKPDFYDSFYRASKQIPKEGSLLPVFPVCANLSSRKELLVSVNCQDMNRPDYLFKSTLFERPVFNDRIVFDFFLSGGGYKEFYNNNKFILYGLKENVIKTDGPVYDFSLGDIFSKWVVGHSNVRYRYRQGLGGVCFSVYYDGGDMEDEFVQVRRHIPEGIDVSQYPYLEMVFRIEDPTVQFIEIVLGVDVDGDTKIDHFVQRLHKKDVMVNRFNTYRLNVHELLREAYPGKENFIIYHIEFYPHKKWYLDCSKTPRKGWYKFWIKDLKFFNLSLKSS